MKIPTDEEMEQELKMYRLMASKMLEDMARDLQQLDDEMTIKFIYLYTEIIEDIVKGKYDKEDMKWSELEWLIK